MSSSWALLSLLSLPRPEKEKIGEKVAAYFSLLPVKKATPASSIVQSEGEKKRGEDAVRVWLCPMLEGAVVQPP